MTDSLIDDVRKAVSDAYVLYNRSIEHADPSLLLAFYRDLTTEDFVEKGIPGDPMITCTREQMLEALTSLVAAGTFSFESSATAHTRIESLQAIGNSFAIKLEHTFRTERIDREGRYGTAGDSHRFEDLDCWEEIWTRVGTAWLLRVKQRLSIVTRIINQKT